MALTRRTDHAKMWKECFNVYLIVIISGLLYLILLVTSEPVCYTRVFLDESNRYMKKVDCDGTDKICHRFDSSEDVNLFDLLDSPCGYPEDHLFTHNPYKVICSTIDLPTVTDGSFDCAPNTDVSIGDVCTLSCDDGFYVADSDQVVCEAGSTNQEGKWSGGGFNCHAITCSTIDLPTVTNGSFDCAPNTDVSMGEVCPLSCDDGFYVADTDQVVCEARKTNQEGKWSEGSFNCHVITCQDVHLPTVNDGSFNCSGYSVGGKCNLTCGGGYYPSATKYTVCREYDDHKANWTAGVFQCSAIACQEVHLPAVYAGFFNCSGYSVGDKCNLACDDGYYPSSSNETVCEEYDNHMANWTIENFQCSGKIPTVKSIKCSTTNLPIVSEGSFDCADNSDVSVGEACNLRCNNERYPAYSRQAVCVAGTSNQGGVWSDGNFVCQLLECSIGNEWNGSVYKHTSTRQSWDASHQLCESENSHLVTIENKEENKFVHKIARYCTQDLEAWIGLNDRNTEGTWEWSDGTVSSYENWDEGQPNGGDAPDCVRMYRVNGKWYAKWCTDERHAICERNNPPT